MTGLTKQELSQFRQRLLQQREQLRGDIQQALHQSETHNYADIIGRVRDAGENSVTDLVESLNLTAIEREAKELRDVEDALERVREGTYGRCLECGQEIERDRLEVNPSARYCLDDQRRREKDRAGGQDVTPSL